MDMNMKKSSNGGFDMKIKRQDDEISIGQEDSYSQRSLVSEPDDYEEDSFLEIERGENLKRRKNLNMDCCRKTLDCHEQYFLMKLHKEKRKREKIEKKMNEDIDRNREILREIKKCKEAIYVLLKGKWKVQLRYNNHDEEDDE